MMNISDLILSTVISTGVLTAIITGFLKYNFDRKVKAHDLKLEKYLKLIEQLAKLHHGSPDDNVLYPLLNEALFFASDNVAAEILRFNILCTKRRKESLKKGSKDFQIKGEEIMDLIEAIRGDLYLKSEAIRDVGIRFFMREK